MVKIYRAMASKNGVNYVYIGQTKNLEKRKLQHERDAFSNKPTSFHQEMRKVAIDDWVWKKGTK